MNLQRTGIAIFAAFIVVISVLITLNLSSQEKKHNIKRSLQKGYHLVNLIAVYPVRDVDDERRDFFLRILSEYASEGLAYLYIHDIDGREVLSLSLSDVYSQIPPSWKTDSIQSLGYIEQHYTDEETGRTVYEFAKPVFGSGSRIGTIRLGLQDPVTESWFSLQRISLLAMVTFFVISALIFGYYGITHALKPVEHLSKNFRNTFADDDGGDRDEVIGGAIAPIIDSLEQSRSQIKEKLSRIETDNMELTAKLSVTTFEKNQIVKILDAVNFGIIIMDVQENVNHINDYMLALLNKERDEVVDHPFGEIIGHPEIKSFIVQQEMVGQTRTVNPIVVTFPELAPGESFKVSVANLMGGENTPIGLMISVTNITAESMAEEKQQDFIAHVAHELLTPLTNIKSYSEMLMDGEVDDIEMQKEFYNTINEQTDRLSNLIRNLLQISKMEGGSMSLSKGLVKTDWFVEDCISTIEGSAKDKNITIVKALPDIFPAMMADKELLKVALNNILGNAVKYTPEGGSITFSISEQDHMVVFDITDTGFGIGEEDLPHVFEKFYRSDDGEITTQSGSGLGLATTAEIVHLHDGEVTVRSDQGRGSQFTVRIPKEEYTLGKQ